jgi:hypothetical protein
VTGEVIPELVAYHLWWHFEHPDKTAFPQIKADQFLSLAKQVTTHFTKQEWTQIAIPWIKANPGADGAFDLKHLSPNSSA